MAPFLLDLAELGLDENQREAIRKITVKMAKDKVRKNAEIESKLTPEQRRKLASMRQGHPPSVKESRTLSTNPNTNPSEIKQ